MTADISGILRDWPFEPGRINVRLVDGHDGRKKIQIRVQLGVLQLELDGRPDGHRPHGFESLLEYQRDRALRYERESRGAAGFVLTPAECRALREEGVMFYHRYVGLFVLEDYEGVLRDTTRNLSLLDLLNEYAAEDSDRHSLEQFRPHLIMMRARAEAARAISGKDAKAALRILDRAIIDVRAALSVSGIEQDADQSNELDLLTGMRDALVPRLPASQRVELEERLAAAIAAENFELAAILRDELRMLRE
jgi:hypothetical protein